MEFLSYKTFVWPRNPHTYREKLVREPQFYTENGRVYYDSMGPLKRVITGSGVFYGPTAYEDFRALIEIFEQDTAGNLDHPNWGIHYCYFTRLELNQEPRENFVSYEFEFTCAALNGAVPA